MDTATAETTLYAIAGAGFVFWLAAGWFVRSRSRGAGTEGADRLELGEPEQPTDFAGSAEIAGRPDELSARAAAALAKGSSVVTIGPVKILERTPARLVFEVFAQASQRRLVRRAELCFTARGGDRTDVGWAAQIERSGGLLLAAKIVHFIGLLVLVAGFFLIRTYVIPSEDPGVRGQVVQMAQCVHFLWPPFLLAGLDRVRIRTVRTWLEVFVNNLPHQRA